PGHRAPRSETVEHRARRRRAPEAGRLRPREGRRVAAAHAARAARRHAGVHEPGAGRAPPPRSLRARPLGGRRRAVPDARRAAAELDETVLAPDLVTARVQDLVHKREIARRLKDDRTLTSEQREEAARRLAAIEAEGIRRHREGRDDIVRGAGSPKGTPAG